MTGAKVTIIRMNDPPPRNGEDPAVVANLINANLDEFIVLEKGTQTGNASVAICAKLPDGREVFIQTTAKIFAAMAAAMKGALASWGEPWPGV